MPNTKPDYTSYAFIQEWKDAMWELIKVQYPDMQKKKAMTYLDGVIEKEIHNIPITLINNYTNKVLQIDVLSLVDMVRRYNLILGGGGVLYYSHADKPNILLDFIRHVKTQRSVAKKARKNFDKGTFQWKMLDLLQLNMKLVINSLYGACGYPKFHLYNRYIAESVTNQGRQIITTAINCVESCLGDNVQFATSSDLFNFIRATLEYTRKHKDEIDMSMFSYTHDMDAMLLDRLVAHCAFDYKTILPTLTELISGMSPVQIVMIYYRNNMDAFNDLPKIHELYHRAIDPIDKLENCEIKDLGNEDSQKAVKELNRLYVLHVYSDTPVFDRVRKAMYTDKNTSLYTDTDSIFVSLNKLVKYIENEVIKDNSRDPITFDVTCMNLLLIIVNDIIAKALRTLCEYMGTDPEVAKELIMKNEFVFLRIFFIDKKKRYISLAIYQEGQLLGGGAGLPEIKGFDFLKSTTKANVREFYTKIVEEDILKPEEIDTAAIYHKIMELKSAIQVSMKNGESTYFKQANVQVIEHYKQPYSNQGSVAVMIWNAVCPDYAMELPTDVDIVPIIDLTYKKPAKKADGKVNAMVKSPRESNKNIAMIAEKFPELYDKLYENIYSNANPLIRHMNITSLAKPKNSDVPLPDWFSTVLDSGKVVNDTIGLFLPIMKVLGMKTPKIGGGKLYLSNIIEL